MMQWRGYGANKGIVPAELQQGMEIRMLLPH